MAYYASKVKVDWSLDPEPLLVHAQEIAVDTSKRLRSSRPSKQGISRETPDGLRTLNPEAQKLLLKNSISPLPLHKTLILLETIENHEDKRFYHHERLALAKAAVTNISNLRFGPEVGVGKAKYDAPVIEAWLQNVRIMANDLKEVRGCNQPEASVYCGDARRLNEMLEPNSVDAIITSPPYPNEKDYSRTTRLESVLLGFIQNKQDLRVTKQAFVRSNTRNVYKSDLDDLLVYEHESIKKIAEAIEQRRIELGKTSGFERLYSRVTMLYFGGMKRHLSNFRSILRPGAQLAYVVGDQASYLRVMIRTGQLLVEIAESLGYKVTGIDLFRTRFATATKEQLREEVVMLQWPGRLD